MLLTTLVITRDALAGDPIVTPAPPVPEPVVTTPPPPAPAGPTGTGSTETVGPATPDANGAAPPSAEVVVRGASPERERKESPYSVTVIDVKRQAGRANDVAELLNRSAGVKVRMSGGEGSDTRLSIRGLEGRRVAVFLNGVPVNTDDGTFSLNNIPLPLIDRIEIYKGIVPAEFGGDGLGSAINIVSRNIQQSYIDAGYTYGSYNTHRMFAVTRYWDPEDRFVVDLGILGNHASNDYLMAGPRAGTFVRRDHDRYDQVLGSAGVEFRKLWFNTLRFDVSSGGSLKQLEGLPNSATLRNNVREAEFGQRTLTGRWTLVKNGIVRGLDLSYGLSLAYSRGEFSDLSPFIYDFYGGRRANPNGRGEVGFGPNDSDNKRYELRQRINLHYTIDAHQSLNLNSFLVRTWDRPSDRIANAAAGFNVSQLPGGLFTSALGLAYQTKFFDDRLSTVVGVKHFYIDASGKLGNIYETVNNAALAVLSNENHAFGYNAGVRYAIVRPLAVKLSYEHAARLPTTQEIFGNGFTILGAVNLRPEVADNVDLGFYFDERFDGGSRLQIETSGFYSHVQDLISLIGSFTPEYANIGEARIVGVDVDGKADITKHVSLYANATYQEAVDITPFQPGTNQPSFVYGLRIPNIPYLFANAGGSVQFETPGLGPRARTRMFYDFTAVARYFYDYQLSVHQTKDIPSYRIHSVGVQQTLQDSRYSIDVEVINLGNTLYEDQFARPLPGRAFRVFFRTTAFDG